MTPKEKIQALENMIENLNKVHAIAHAGYIELTNYTVATVNYYEKRIYELRDQINQSKDA